MPSKRKITRRFQLNQWKRSWMVFAGIAAALVLGFSLAQMAIGPTFAGSNQKLDALNAIQRIRETASNNPNMPPKHPRHGALLSSAPSQLWPSGIIESGQAPFPGELSVISNQWQEEVDGVHLSVYAGSEAQDPSEGVVMVMTLSLDLQTSVGPQTYLTPSHTGALHITGARGQYLVLTSTSGMRFSFFVTPSCAMSQPTTAGTECQLSPTQIGFGY